MTKPRSLRNIVARKVIAEAAANGFPPDYTVMRVALTMSNTVIDGLYDAGLHVSKYLCRTCARHDIRAVRT